MQHEGRNLGERLMNRTLLYRQVPCTCVARLRKFPHKLLVMNRHKILPLSPHEAQFICGAQYRNMQR